MKRRSFLKMLGISVAVPLPLFAAKKQAVKFDKQAWFDKCLRDTENLGIKQGDFIIVKDTTVDVPCYGGYGYIIKDVVS